MATAAECSFDSVVVLSPGDVDDLVDDYREWQQAVAIVNDPRTLLGDAFAAMDERDTFNQYESRDGHLFPLDFTRVADVDELRGEPERVLVEPFAPQDFSPIVVELRDPHRPSVAPKMIVRLFYDGYETDEERERAARYYAGLHDAVVWVGWPRDREAPICGLTRCPLPQPPAAKSEPPISNALVSTIGEVESVTPLKMADVLGCILKRTGDWPRRVDRALFVPDKAGAGWIDSQSALFGWLASQTGIIDWYRNRGCVSREDVFNELRRTATNYRAVETIPHEPMLADHYYAHEPIEPTDGATMIELLNRFSPETDADQDLILAAFLTTIWGGPPGARPCFVITSDAGRGIGKSKLAEMIGHVAGGHMDFSQKDEIGDIKARLLSPQGLTQRVALLDNVKSHKLSWAELEALITAPAISGKRLYVGEASRPNTITWFLTLNGAALSTDMTQRSIIIKLKRPMRSGNWEEETLQFILSHRRQIISDLVGCLRAPAARLDRFSRWATWERAVLARLPDPAAAQRAIAERQETVDVEGEEISLIQDFFDTQLRQLGYNPDRDEVFIPSNVAHRWVNWALGTNDKVGSVSSMLKQHHSEGRLQRIMPNPSRAKGRGFNWSGEHVDCSAVTRYDLEKKLSERNDAKKNYSAGESDKR